MKTSEITEWSALKDGLTGLFNRRFAAEELNRQADFSNRYGGSISLLILDLDHFGLVNDHLGPLSGDEILKKGSQIILSAIRPMDSACRLEKDRFLVILPQTRKEDASRLAVRLGRDFSEAVFIVPGNPELKMTVSIGAVEYRPQENISQVLDRAETALFSAKERGRNLTVSL